MLLCNKIRLQVVSKVFIIPWGVGWGGSGHFFFMPISSSWVKIRKHDFPGCLELPLPKPSSFAETSLWSFSDFLVLVHAPDQLVLFMCHYGMVNEVRLILALSLYRDLDEYKTF